jgi:hypothetical protein
METISLILNTIVIVGFFPACYGIYKMIKNEEKVIAFEQKIKLVIKVVWQITKEEISKKLLKNA